MISLPELLEISLSGWELALLGALLVFIALCIQTFASWWRLRHVPGPFWSSISILPLSRLAGTGRISFVLDEVQRKYGMYFSFLFISCPFLSFLWKALAIIARKMEETRRFDAVIDLSKAPSSASAPTSSCSATQRHTAASRARAPASQRGLGTSRRGRTG